MSSESESAEYSRERGEIEDEELRVECRICLPVWMCELCDEYNQTVEAWVAHIRKEHLNILKCSKCEIDFSSSVDGFKHFEENHMKRYRCSQCYKFLDAESEFASHTCGVPQFDYDGWLEDEDGRSYLPFYYDANRLITKPIYSEEYYKKFPEEKYW